MTDAAAWIGESSSTRTISSMAALRGEAVGCEEPREKEESTGSGHIPL
jgi:hypothetical protein